MPDSKKATRRGRAARAAERGEGVPPVVAAPGPSLRRTVIQDLKRGDLSSALKRDLRQIYGFFLDEERRAHLARMGRLRRCFWVIAWLLKSLLMRLSPSRRLLLLGSLILWIWNRTEIQVGDAALSLNLRFWSFPLLLLVLMMELKDKLLARDEIEVARQVQIALLPREHPRFAGWSIWSYMQPANDVGADLVDYIDLGRRGLGVVLGDVSGKGLGAALLTAKLQATIRALLPGHPSLASLGAELNTILHRDGLDNRFATLFFFEIEEGKGEIHYLNAGHNPPFVVREESVEPLAASALPLGMMQHVEYAEGHLSLAPGDMLLVYSDGLTEARNAGDEEFGEQRLRALLPLIRPLPVDQAGLRILHEVNVFLAGERPHDDLSLIVALRV
jgi:phosphoserine phosphatase RsbU/P